MVLKNTQKATDWAVGVFKQWLGHHNAVAEKIFPTEDVSVSVIGYVFSRWKIRNDNREEYTPRSVTQILSGLQRLST